jgi:hypothetical protein
MSTPTERAAEALHEQWCGNLDDCPGPASSDGHLARAALTAAVSDREALARVIDAHRPLTTPGSAVRCWCGQWVENHGLHLADAVAAYLTDGAA